MGQAADAFRDKVDEMLSSGKAKTRPEACRLVNKQWPKLREHMLAEANPRDQDILNHPTFTGLPR